MGVLSVLVNYFRDTVAQMPSFQYAIVTAVYVVYPIVVFIIYFFHFNTVDYISTPTAII